MSLRGPQSLVHQDTAKFYFLEVNTRLQARPRHPAPSPRMALVPALAGMTAGMGAPHTAGMLLQNLLGHCCEVMAAHACRWSMASRRW